MNVSTRARDFELTEALDTFIREQVANSLARFAADIIAVDVFMKDTNGPKGGPDKQALVRVRLRNRQLMATETTHEDVYAGLKTGIRRMKRAVRRQLRKSLTMERERLREMARQASLLQAPPT
jgi:ribosomal subunit interface protein